jgi:hypothetical protein
MNADRDGTCLVGNVVCRYKDLERAFGKPIEADGYKVSGEWVFISRDGKRVFTVYDWKMTSLYDEDYPSVDQFRSSDKRVMFNIGGEYGTDSKEFEAWLSKQIGG